MDPVQRYKYLAGPGQQLNQQAGSQQAKAVFQSRLGNQFPLSRTPFPPVSRSHRNIDPSLNKPRAGSSIPEGSLGIVDNNQSHFFIKFMNPKSRLNKITEPEPCSTRVVLGLISFLEANIETSADQSLISILSSQQLTQKSTLSSGPRSSANGERKAFGQNRFQTIVVMVNDGYCTQTTAIYAQPNCPWLLLPPLQQSCIFPNKLKSKHTLPTSRKTYAGQRQLELCTDGASTGPSSVLKGRPATHPETHKNKHGISQNWSLKQHISTNSRFVVVIHSNFRWYCKALYFTFVDYDCPSDQTLLDSSS